MCIRDRDILNKGVDSLGFYVKKKDLSPEYIETLLNDICAECIELNFSTCQGDVYKRQGQFPIIEKEQRIS